MSSERIGFTDEVFAEIIETPKKEEESKKDDKDQDQE
jgi:hypothetical protein